MDDTQTEKLSLYHDIMESLPIAFYDMSMTDEGSKISDVLCNSQFLDFIGINTDDKRVCKQVINDLIHPDDRKEVQNKFHTACENHSIYFIECRIKHTDGNYYWTLFEGRIMYDNSGKAVRHSGIIIDINEHFQREKILQEVGERYRRITETLSDYVYTVKVKNGAAVNTIHGGACQAVTGYTPADFANNPNLWIEMVHEQDRAAVAARAQQMLKGKNVEQLEHRIIHRNGSVRWVRSIIVPHRDENGEILFFDGVIRDVTQEKQQAEVLQQKHYMNEILLNSVPYASVLLDEDGEVIAVNSQGTLLGFAPNTNWEHQWAELSGGKDGEEVLVSAIDKNERRQIEIVNNGVYYETTFVPMEPDLCLVCFYNITRRKTFERKMNTNRMLTEAIINSNQAFVLIINVDETVYAINQLTEQLINKPNAEVAGKNIHEVFVPEQAEKCASIIKEVTTTNTSVSYRDTFKERYMDTHALPVYDDRQNITQVIFFARDYSKEKHAEMNLIETYQILTAIVENSPAAIVALSNDNLVKSWSPAGETLFGWQPADVCGKPSFWLNDRNAPAAPRHEVSVTCKNGTLCQAVLTDAPLMDIDGQATGHLLIIERQ